jgi:type VI secretion system secreted protein VgrG
MSTLELSFSSSQIQLSVRRFSVVESISAPFTISLLARSPDPCLDLGEIVSKSAAFRVTTGHPFAHNGGERTWTGICRFAEQLRAETTVHGLSTYHLEIVPELWRLTQKRGYHIHQHRSIPDIVDELLGAWNIAREWQVDRVRHPLLEQRVQYGESDHAFVCRLLEEAGIAFTFAEADGVTRLVLSDAPQRALPRQVALRYVDNPSGAPTHEIVSRIQLAHEARPSAMTIRDHDFRRPHFALLDRARAETSGDRDEQFHYTPGAFLVEGNQGGGTPVADARGVARHDPQVASAVAQRTLHAERTGHRAILFETNCVDLGAGVVFGVDGHPHPELPETRRLLVTAFRCEGEVGLEWSMSGQAVFADAPYRPARSTPKPVVHGVQSAFVTGLPGLEIHTDEFGRVRVQFPWDRKGQHDDASSCWMRVSQGWAGVGFGSIAVPRIGQEVLVAFFDGDPDQPVIVGRVFNQTNRVPWELPAEKATSGWKSDSSPGSGGFNEIRFEDRKGEELYALQAERNLRALVKHDETITVGNDRAKLVRKDETDITGANRVEVTRADRSETTLARRMTVIGANRRARVKGDATERATLWRARLVGKDRDLVIGGTRRAMVEGDSHHRMEANHSEQVDGTLSTTVEQDLLERIGGSHALGAGSRLDLRSGGEIVGEGADDVTLAGPGGFVRIDASGVSISGTLVRINAGGSAGKGKAPAAESPTAPREGRIHADGKTVSALVSPIPGARRILFEGTGAGIDIYKLDKASPEWAAVLILKGQGRAPLIIRQILESATDFRRRDLKKGEMLYAFVSRSKPTKSASSAYWLDEAELEKLKGTHLENGRWRSSAIKDLLALPCVNSADEIVMVEVIEDHAAVAATVLPATDKIFTKRSGEPVVRRTRTMVGGGTQLTPSSKALGPIHLLSKGRR